MRGSATGGNSTKKTPQITENSNLLNYKQHGTRRLKSAAQGMHQRAQRSHTLMRTAVRKPAKALSAASATKLPQPKTRGTASIDGARSARSHYISKNAKVRRFGHVSSGGAGKAPRIMSRATLPLPSKPKIASDQQAVSKPLPSLVTSVSHQQLERLLDEALTKADAHKKALNGRSRTGLWQKVKFAPRWLTFGVAFVVLVVVAGFVAWHKIPQVAMRVASTRAHVDAKIPAYTPTGFSLATPVKYENGSVSVKFKANDDGSRSFTLIQKSSNMDSKSLADSVIPRGAQVQTSTINGTTVYIYGDNNDAAWVNHGVQYTIADNADLNSDQLLKLADSL